MLAAESWQPDLEEGELSPLVRVGESGRQAVRRIPLKRGPGCQVPL